jgi:anti-sigma B factor antagonist
MEDPTTSPEPSTIEVVPHPETIAVMHLSGPLDRESAPDTRATIAAAIAAGHQDLILDVRDVPTIDGAGAQTLAFGMHRAQQAGGDLRLVAPTDQVMQRLELGNHEIPSHATVVEALEANAVVSALQPEVTMDAQVAEAGVKDVASAVTSGIPVLDGSSSEPRLQRADERVDRYGQGFPVPSIPEVRGDPGQ